ncbi:MAG: 30S ribosomal protein S27ae [Conexivisphaera sp.]
MKGKQVQVWKYYRVEGGTLTRLRRECPRCGAGVFMAQHADRLYCGRCGHTIWTEGRRAATAQPGGTRGSGRGRRP